MKTNPVILFDGVCNLCNGSVQFVIRHDANKIFRFASLQSNEAARLLKEFNFSETNWDSFILIENGKLFTRSTAALRVTRHLSAPYSLLYAAIIVPAFIRNWVYDVIARNRYRWFGKKSQCMMPTEELKSRFLNNGQ